MAKKKQFDAEEILDFQEDEPHFNGTGIASLDPPLRTCIVDRTKTEKSSLLRFVRSPEGELVPDLAARLPGRGVWVSARRSMVEKAIKRGGFHRSFKTKVVIRKDVGAQIEQLLKRDVIQKLAMAKKSGLVVTGFAKVEDGIKRGDIVGLLHASEAADDGRLKLRRRFEGMGAAKYHIAPGNDLTQAEISLATGNTSAIHVGLKDGGAVRAFFEAMSRYSNYCETGQ